MTELHEAWEGPFDEMRLIDEDPLPDGFDIESMDNGAHFRIYSWKEDFDVGGANTYKAAVRLAWAIEQGLRGEGE